MTSLLQLKNLFESLTKKKIYVINFPLGIKEAIKIETIGGVSELGGVYDFNVQFMIKGNHPAETEAVSFELIKDLNNVTDKIFNNNQSQLILMQVSNPHPTYVGETTEGEYIHSIDFRILTCNI